MNEALSLSALLEGKSSEIENFKEQLSLRGWCFVHLTEDLLEKRNRIISLLQDFFNEDVTVKDRFTEDSPSIFGYQRVNHKESLRWLTKERFDENKFPDSLRSNIVELTSFMDDLMKDLVDKTSQEVFDMDTTALGDACDLSLFSSDITKKKFGMLDVAHYLNDKSKYFDKESNIIPPKNCVEHYDPGLLSLSFYSSQPGLQVLDLETEIWHDGPCNSKDEEKNYGIIWCGSAAAKVSKNAIKPAIHRVEYPEESNTAPRMSIWYEICTFSQETDYLQVEKSKKIPSNIFIDENGTDRPIHVKELDLIRVSPSLDSTDSSNHEKERATRKRSKSSENPAEKEPSFTRSIINSIFSFGSKKNRNTVERKTGVPPSKSRRPKNYSTEKLSGVPMTKALYSPNYDDLILEKGNDMGVIQARRKNGNESNESNDTDELFTLPPDFKLERNYGVPQSKSMIPPLPKKTKGIEYNLGVPESKSMDDEDFGLEYNLGVPESKVEIMPDFDSFNFETNDN